MTKIRQFPEITVQAPTDAFLIDREGEGTFYIEAQNIVTPPGTLVVTQQDGTTVVAATVAMNFTGGAEVTADGTTANVRIPIQNDGTVTSVDISGGTSGLTSTGGPITSSGTLTLGGILNVANGGTGTPSPALTAGSNITLSGSWPNYTISADASSLRVDTTPIANGGSGNLLYDNSGTLGEYPLVPVSKGGTGTATPGLVAGTNVTITGSWPNQTINSSGGGGGSLTVGTTAIASGTSGYILYDNAGVLGNLATTGSGSVVQATSPVLVTPNLGTPSAATLTNATGLPLTTGTTGILTVAKGGTGTSSPGLVAGSNVTISGSWPNQTINSSASAGGLTIGSSTIASGTSGYILYNNAGVLGNLSTIPVANGGTGTSTPSLVAGTNVTISGSWPNQTINSSGGNSAVTINAQTGTAYTLVLSDAQKMVTMNNASANTLTVPLNASVAFPTGTTVAIQQIGAGKTTIAATGGVTINYLSTLTLAIAGQYGVAQLIKTGTDTWTLFGAIGG